MTRFQKTRFLAGALVLAATGVALANRPARGHALSVVDRNFLKETNQANNAERAYVPIVMSRSTNVEIKRYGQHMIHDHTQANQELVGLAAQKGVKLPHNVPPEERAVINRLGRDSGSRFDLAYKHEMIRDHTADIGAFKREISIGSDPDVKAFAAKYLPVLQRHLKMAQDLRVPRPAGGWKPIHSSTTPPMPRH